MEPLIRGKYPSTMRSSLKDRLPRFTDEQAHRVKGSFDFIGLNYYSTVYVRDNPSSNDTKNSNFYEDDTKVELTGKENHPTLYKNIRMRNLFKMKSYSESLNSNSTLFKT